MRFIFKCNLYEAEATFNNHFCYTGKDRMELLFRELGLLSENDFLYQKRGCHSCFEFFEYKDNNFYFYEVLNRDPGNQLCFKHLLTDFIQCDIRKMLKEADRFIKHGFYGEFIFNTMNLCRFFNRDLSKNNYNENDLLLYIFDKKIKHVSTKKRHHLSHNDFTIKNIFPSYLNECVNNKMDLIREKYYLKKQSNETRKL